MAETPFDQSILAADAAYKRAQKVYRGARTAVNKDLVNTAYKNLHNMQVMRGSYNANQAGKGIHPPDVQSELTGDQRNAGEFLSAIFTTYGLQSLAPKIMQYVRDGYDSNTIQALLPETDEYKKRFAGNQERIRRGLPALSPGQYVENERQYTAIARSMGLPEGFYDQQSDFTDYIGNDLSPVEFQDRVNELVSAGRNSDPNYRKFLSEQFNVHLDDAQIGAYFLDPKRALPTIKRALAASSIGAAAAAQGASLTAAKAEGFMDRGLDAAAVGQGYQNVNQVAGRGSQLGSVYGQAYGADVAEREFLYGDTDAQRKRERLAGKERSSFGGSGAAGRGSLGRDSGSY